LKVQNFKDNFNTFGAEHGQGHFLGDAGIAAVGSVLRETLEKRFAEEGVRVHIGNAGAESLSLKTLLLIVLYKI